MGILGKLLFWKKEDDLDFDKLTDKELEKSGLPPTDDLGLEQKPAGLEEKSHFEAPAMEHPASVPPMQPSPLPGQAPPPPPTVAGERTLELISSKLDTIKAILTSMEQRIANLEKAAGTEDAQKQVSGTAYSGKEEEKLW